MTGGGPAFGVPAGQLTCNWAAFTTIGTSTVTAEPAPVPLEFTGPTLKVTNGAVVVSVGGTLAVITLTVTQPSAPVKCLNLPELLTPSAEPAPTPLKVNAKLMA